MKIVVTGSEGQIGWELMQTLTADQKFQSDEIVGVDRSRLDLTDADSVRNAIRSLKPDLIINAAGYTAVDRAESEPALPRAVNATAVGVMGEEAKRRGAAVIHYSTDYVFDGTKTTPYLPGDPPNPQSVYGKTKLEGERALLDSGAASLALRTAWVYGARRRNFLLAILRQAKTKPELRVVNDQTGSPTSCRAIATATAQIISRSLCRNDAGHWSFSGKEGIYHIAAGGVTTWFEFASAALALAPMEPPPRVIPVSTEEFAAPAKRPKYSVLDCQSTKRDFGVELPDWGMQLQDVMRDKAVQLILREKGAGC